MTNAQANNLKLKAPLIELSKATVEMPGGRVLFKDLSMSLGNEKVALIGRNGVGKSTLLEIVSGERTLSSGRAMTRSKPCLVRQVIELSFKNCEDIFRQLHQKLHFLPVSKQLMNDELAAAGISSSHKTCSHGEMRKLQLLLAKLASPSVLLLDEPTEDLDDHGVFWLRNWIANWQGCLLVASHDKRLLTEFNNFFIIAESGCRYFSGSFQALQDELEEERTAIEKRYTQNLSLLVAREKHITHIARRRRRKKQYGRARELKRATPRQRLNQKRDYAQVKHGRMAKVREARRLAIREWAKSTRRALHVCLPMTSCVPTLQAAGERDLISLTDVSAVVGDKCLFKKINLRLQRERLAIKGSNGTGKTTLLQIMLGERAPASGSVKIDHLHVGAIMQNGSNWMLEESLLSYLHTRCGVESSNTLAEILISHKFPLALGERPLKSLSPGERVRAALICLFQRAPALELLVLDEPNYSLDLVGQDALTEALRAWPGGIVVASHNTTFLESIGLDCCLRLGVNDLPIVSY